MKHRYIDGLNEDEFDNLVLVLGLHNYGWSYRKIGRAISRHKDTVKSMVERALRLKRGGKLAKNTISERAIDVSYVGGTQDLERIELANLEIKQGKIKRTPRN